MSTKKHPAHYIGANVESRSPRDFYSTPKSAIIPILERETFPQMIWEPACGGGVITETLMEYYNRNMIFSSDVYDYGFRNEGFSGLTCYGEGGDFFYAQENMYCFPNGELYPLESIVTNPPYQIIHPKFGCLRVEDWIQKGHDLGVGKMAFLLKTVALAGIKRTNVLQNCGLEYVYQFRERLDMLNGSGQKSMVDFAWFVFNRGFYGSPKIHWITQEK